MKVAQEIAHLIPYRPGKPISETQREYGLTDVIKLASNENPLGASPLAMKALQKIASQLHYYPDPMGFDIVQKISALWKVDKKNIALGNGSNEIIDLLIRIFCDPRSGQKPEKIAIFDKAFIAYQLCAQAARIETITVPVDAQFNVDLNLMADTIEKNPEIRLVFIPNPNNPTGNYIPESQLTAFLKRVGKRENLLLVFDEAYHEFVEAKDYSSAVKFMSEYPSVVVLRTFSKIYGLAGVRLGVMLAQPEVVDFYHRVRNPFNTSNVAQATALAALDDTDFILKSQKLVWNGKKQIYSALKEMGLPWTPTEGNFILFHTLRDGATVYEQLLRKGVILRPLGNYGLPYHLRWTVGTFEENVKVIAALKEVLVQIPVNV